MKDCIELFFQLKPPVQIVLVLALVALLFVIVTNHSTEENFVNLLLIFQYLIGGNLNRGKNPNLDKQ